MFTKGHYVFLANVLHEAMQQFDEQEAHTIMHLREKLIERLREDNPLFSAAKFRIMSDPD